MTVLVTGASGYTGSHMLLCLQDAGISWLALHDSVTQPAPLPTVLTGADSHCVTGVSDCALTCLPYSDTARLSALLQKYNIQTVIHFPSSGTVRQSVKDPLRVFDLNTVGTFSLVKACVAAQCVRSFVLSSTASVYGIPNTTPISEGTALQPISPYGASMAMAERLVDDVTRAHGINTAILRYFNVAGADPQGRAGEGGKPRHLLKAAAQIAVGVRKEKLQIYGDDYATTDGTCIRDYVHVSDMASAHYAAARYLEEAHTSVTLNCGYGLGASIRDVLACMTRVTGITIPEEVVARRPGDPPVLIADNAAIRSILDWAPRFEDLDFIVRTAVDWEEKVRGTDTDI